jgi:hypothetical protein
MDFRIQNVGVGGSIFAVGQPATGSFGTIATINTSNGFWFVSDGDGWRSF